MVTCKSILVPTDFSETSRAALDYGRALADRFRSTLHVLHVVSHVVGPGRAMFWGFSASELESRLEEKARHHMEALLLVTPNNGEPPSPIQTTSRVRPEA